MSQFKLLDLIVCIAIKGESCSDLDLDWTMANVKLVSNIFIHYNIFKCEVPNQLFLKLPRLQTDRQIDRQSDRRTHRQKQAEEYSLVALKKRNHNNVIKQLKLEYLGFYRENLSYFCYKAIKPILSSTCRLL